MTSWHGNVTDPVCDGIHLAPVMRNFEVVVEPNKLSKKTFELQTIWDAMTLTWRSYYYKQNGRHFAADNLKCIFTLGQFWPSGIVIACVCLCPRVRPCVSVSMCVCVCLCVCVCQSLACPRDNSEPVEARITKFGLKMQKTLVRVPFVLVGNWPWPPRSNLT